MYTVYVEYGPSRTVRFNNREFETAISNAVDLMWAHIRSKVKDVISITIEDAEHIIMLNIEC